MFFAEKNTRICILGGGIKLGVTFVFVVCMVLNSQLNLNYPAETEDYYCCVWFGVCCTYFFIHTCRNRITTR